MNDHTSNTTSELTDQRIEETIAPIQERLTTMNKSLKSLMDALESQQAQMKTLSARQPPEETWAERQTLLAETQREILGESRSGAGRSDVQAYREMRPVSPSGGGVRGIGASSDRQTDDQSAVAGVSGGAQVSAGARRHDVQSCFCKCRTRRPTPAEAPISPTPPLMN